MENIITIEEFNDFFKKGFTSNKCISENKSPEYLQIEKSNGEGDQGVQPTVERVYKFNDKLFIKIVFTFDSYNDNPVITSMKFVKQVKKEILIYE